MCDPLLRTLLESLCGSEGVRARAREKAFTREEEQKRKKLFAKGKTKRKKGAPLLG